MGDLACWRLPDCRTTTQSNQPTNKQHRRTKSNLNADTRKSDPCFSLVFTHLYICNFILKLTSAQSLILVGVDVRFSEPYFPYSSEYRVGLKTAAPANELFFNSSKRANDTTKHNLLARLMLGGLVRLTIFNAVSYPRSVGVQYWPFLDNRLICRKCIKAANSQTWIPPSLIQQRNWCSSAFRRIKTFSFEIIAKPFWVT